MTIPLPDVPDTGKIADGNNRINEDRAALAELDAAKVDRTEVYDGSGTVFNKIPRYDGIGRLIVATPSAANQAASKAYVDAAVPTIPSSPRFSNCTVTGSFYTPNSSVATSSYTVAYINGDGRISRGASSRRYKTDIQPFDVPDEQIALLETVTYLWDQAAFPDVEPPPDTARQVGLIAEDVFDAIPWLVVVNEDGTPEAVHYEQVGVALVPAVQRLLERVSALEARVTELEGDTA